MSHNEILHNLNRRIDRGGGLTEPHTRGEVSRVLTHALRFKREGGRHLNSRRTQSSYLGVLILQEACVTSCIGVPTVPFTVSPPLQLESGGTRGMAACLSAAGMVGEIGPPADIVGEVGLALFRSCCGLDAGRRRFRLDESTGAPDRGEAQEPSWLFGRGSSELEVGDAEGPREGFSPLARCFWPCLVPCEQDESRTRRISGNIRNLAHRFGLNPMSQNHTR